MSETFERIRRLLRELKRRNVYKVAVTYAVVAFVVWQAASMLFPALRFPSWTVDFVIILTLLGFPIALVVAWAFEMSPEGVRRTPEAVPSERLSPEEPGKGTRTAYKVLVGIGLVAAAVAGGWYLTGGGGGSPEVSDRSVAVLPFEALGQEQAGALTEGMHSDLQTKLSNIAGLTVTSSRAVEQYRGSDESTAAVARQLGVGWIVSGDVQRMSDQIQVTVRLVDPETDTQAWTDSYRRDRTADNLFAIQTDITKKVARALETELSPEESDRVERQPTRSLEAHRLYTQGRRLMLSRRPDSLRRAIDRFERAIEQDSSYALAWAGLSDARILHANYSVTTPEIYSDSLAAALPEAEFAARRALQLDSELAEAHASRAILYMYEQVLPEGRATGPIALRHLRRAVELKPSYAQAHDWLGSLLGQLGRPDRSLEHNRVAVLLSPDNRSARQTFIWALLANGEYDEALSEARRLQDAFPSGSRDAKAFALGHLKRWGEVQTLAEEFRNNTDDPPRWTVFVPALADAAVGDTTAARGRIEELRTMGAELSAAVVHAALGESDLAFQKLPNVETWESGGNFALVRYYFPDLLSAFREDPRYEELIREVNEYWGLNPDGSLPDSVDVAFESDG